MGEWVGRAKLLELPGIMGLVILFIDLSGRERERETCCAEPNWTWATTAIIPCSTHRPEPYLPLDLVFSRGQKCLLGTADPEV